MTAEREPGWYWVKLSHEGAWHAVATYGHPREKCWRFDGQIFAESAFAVIGLRALTPDEGLEILKQLRELPENWDSYGSPKITDAALASASVVLTRPGQAVPTSLGGVQVEWHIDGVDLEIEIGPSGEIMWE